MKEVKRIGHKAISFVEDIGLFIIAVATIIAVGVEINAMMEARAVRLADLLLLFIYLEILTMVANYLDYGKLPVRMPLYISIVALARYVIIDMKSMDNWRIVAIAGAILLIALAVFVHRYGHAKFPYEKPDDTANKQG